MNERIKYCFLFVTLLLSFGTVNAQLSPGELSKAHAHLDGLKNCTQCHVLGNKETRAKCLECHLEIQNLIGQNKGYHASADVKEEECSTCHGEHYGRDFEIIYFSEIDFDHKDAGYELMGKHATINCSDCHKPELIQHKISKKKSGSYLGLGTDCLSCHENYHQNTLSTNCVRCHDQNQFVPAVLFNHANTKFQLKGAHIALSCEKCHKISQVNGKKIQGFAGVEFANCTNCHEDVHQKKFGNDCRKCHTENSFHEVKQLSNFNHDKTNFALQGKHVYVDCKTCHKNGFSSAIKHQFCTDCHRDVHQGQFLKNNKVRDCSECHTVNGFLPSEFGIEQHNLLNFNLAGAHLATPCFECHKKSEEWDFKNMGNRCVDCHQNIHKNYLPEKYLIENNCRNCHNETRWGAVQFNHNSTNFPLTGKHARLNCRNCHFKPKETLPDFQQYSGLASTCENCHKDVHFGQFLETNRTICTRCHTTYNWKPELFSHEKTRFILDGKHSGLACKACHTPTKGLRENYIQYKFEDITCAACH